jgi:hypothetical protein
VSKFPQIIRAFQNASRAASGALTRHYLQGGAERCGTYIDHDIDALGCAVVDEREVALMAGQVADLRFEEWERIWRHDAEMDADFAKDGELNDVSFLTKYEVPLGKFALAAAAEKAGLKAMNRHRTVLLNCEGQRAKAAELAEQAAAVAARDGAAAASRAVTAAAAIAADAAAAAPVLLMLEVHGWDVDAAALLGAADADAKHNGALKKAVLRGVLRSLGSTAAIASKNASQLKDLLAAPLLKRAAAAAAAEAAPADGDEVMEQAEAGGDGDGAAGGDDGATATGTDGLGGAMDLCA